MFTKAEAIESFLAKYKVPEPPTPEQQQGDGEEYKFDFAPYPKLLSSLRLVEAFGADSVATVLPGEDARTILWTVLATSARYEGSSDFHELPAMAAAAEEALNKPLASPAMSTLTAANTAGATLDGKGPDPLRGQSLHTGWVHRGAEHRSLSSLIKVLI